VAAILLALGPGTARAEDAAPSDSAAADSAARAAQAPAVPAAPASPGATTARLTGLGLENVSVELDATPPIVRYENRRYRHSAQVLGLVHGEIDGSVTVVERRLGLDAAAITTEGPRDRPGFSVRYPTDRDFPRGPRGRPAAPTSRSLDFVVGPLIGYELGRVQQPVQVAFSLEPRLRYNPWPGARMTTSLVIPVYSDFMVSDFHPDDDRVRPGLVTIEQFAWLPRLALASATVGVFGDNRYGISVGAARPFAEGAFLLDAQADLTGFIAFVDGISYSTASQLSSFIALTWRPPLWDVAIRGRMSQYIYGDQGEEIELKRSLGDFDFALFSQRSGTHYIKGVRINVPVPPMTRSTRAPLRIQPIERFPTSYRTEAENFGISVTGVASREDFLRQLNRPALESNRSRYLAPRGAPRPARNQDPMDWISFSGMTGFINTPSADVIQDRSIELSFSHIPKAWAYDNRGTHVNEPYSVALGLLPHLEIGLRFTRLPGKQGFLDAPDNRLTTDTDHMASFRLTLLTSRPDRPGLAIGMEDVEGTRRFHSSYAVAGIPLSILHVQNRLSMGYAPRVFTAARHVLDGGFGAFEVSPWRAVAARVEYDTEKWNAGIGVGLGYGLRVHVAALNMESVSVGAGWYHKL
jgi:Exopolysaccharide biosynthesis protein YbjH